MASHLCAVERHLHRALEEAVHQVGGNAERLRDLRNALKSRFIAGHGITARHYNSILTALEGRHASGPITCIGSKWFASVPNPVRAVEATVP